MIFLIDILETQCNVVVYDDIAHFVQQVEWQDIFEGNSIIFDENGTEYEWDSSQKNEIGTVYNYTMIPTFRKSKLVTKCLEIIELNKHIQEFNFPKTTEN